MNDPEDEIIEDVLLLCSLTVAAVAGVLCLAGKKDVVKARPDYRCPLSVTVGPVFSLDSLSEEYCLQFFRYEFDSAIQVCLNAGC